ncbi:MAG: T9SS type A sorting domain-containing protein [Chitinophagaceae bacterium]
MRRILLSVIATSFFFIFCNAATITWTGPLISNWNNSANWSTGVVPGANDDVIFNTSVNVEMDIIPATTPFVYLINSLTISSNASVTFTRTQSGGGTRIIQVKSANNAIPGLKIDYGSTLTINAANATGTLNFILDLTGAAGTVGSIDGNLYFTGTGAGTSNSNFRVYTNATNYSACTVSSTGYIKYFSNSGNTASAAGNYLIMQSGSTYEINQNGGAAPYANWDDNSNLLITGATANGSIIFNQAQYGNLKWDCPSMSSATQLISTLSPVTSISVNSFTIANTNGKELRLKTGTSATTYDYTVRGKLDVSASGILVIAGSTVTTAGAGARLHVQGDISIAGTLKSDGTTGTINEIELSGAANQNVSNTGTFSGNQVSFIMNNAAGATLQTSLTLPGTTSKALQLINGKINTVGHPLTMLDNSNYSGGSSSSFVEGPMIKIGDDNFTFPVGKGSIYAPIGFNSTGMATTDAFQAEYFRSNPQTAFGINYQLPINHISYVEYWNLDKITGNVNTPAKVTLAVTQYSFAKDLATLYASSYNVSDMQWKTNDQTEKIAGPVVSPYATGTVTSSPVSPFGIFTIATSEPGAINPLPITLLSFSVKEKNDDQVDINWVVADFQSDFVHYEVERSIDQQPFSVLTSLNANPGSKFYSISDNYIKGEIIRYRLKIFNEDKSVIYSNVVSVVFGSSDQPMKIYPNPVIKSAVIDIYSSSERDIVISMVDAHGRNVQKLTRHLNKGNNRVTLPTERLVSGIYFLFVDTERKTVRFIKQ